MSLPARPRELSLRATLFFASILFFVFSVFSVEKIQAASWQWVIFPGLTQNQTLANYGWHFDEGHNWFGARDFSYGSSSSNVYFRTQMLITQSTNYRYKLVPSSDKCMVTAIPQFLNVVSGQWTSFGGGELHYKHLYTTISNPTYTSSMRYVNDQITSNIGKLATAGYHSDCRDQNTLAVHLHQSADVSPGSYMIGFGVSGDTCWAEVGDDFRCSPGPAWYFGDHYSCPSSYGAYWVAMNGNIWGEYTCETWSQQSFDKDWGVFITQW